VATGHVPALGLNPDGTPRPPDDLLVGDQIRDLVVNHWLAPDQPDRAAFERYGVLAHRLDFLTVAVFVAPLDASGSP
jgi:hypothetical protein